MKLRAIVMTFALLLFVCALNARAADSYKLEPVSSPPQGVSDGLKNLMQPQGYKIVNDQGAVWCEVWIRKEIANLSRPASPEAKYPALHLGELVGLMKFSSPGSDYRGQPIKPGTYAMRYCLILQDGNHLGAAPILDFVLALSRKASGTNHPAVINMAPPPSVSGAATLEKDDLGHWVLKVKTQSKPAADLSIGIIVVGHAEG
jgi:hypothetical protein